MIHFRHQSWSAVDDRLIEVAAAGGHIRKDVESSDVLHALSGVYSTPDSPHWRERSRRLVRLLMHGLRWGGAKKAQKGKLEFALVRMHQSIFGRAYGRRSAHPGSCRLGAYWG